jgi:Flp pilus assembly pilin Flp
MMISAVLARLIHDRGQTLAEYGILIAVIAVVVIVAAILFGTNVSQLFGSAATRA